MRKQNVFLALTARRFLRARRIPAVLPPPIPPRLTPGRWESDPGLNFSNHRAVSFVLAKAAMLLLGLVLTMPAVAGVREVDAINLTVASLDRELAFYTNTL